MGLSRWQPSPSTRPKPIFPSSSRELKPARKSSLRAARTRWRDLCRSQEASDARYSARSRASSTSRTPSSSSRSRKRNCSSGKAAMRILFDSHALVWFLAGDARFSRRARSAVEQEDAIVCVSAVTAWEVTNKVLIGKWPEAAVLAESFLETIAQHGFEPLPISVTHARLAG